MTNLAEQLYYVWVWSISVSLDETFCWSTVPHVALFALYWVLPTFVGKNIFGLVYILAINLHLASHYFRQFRLHSRGFRYLVRWNFDRFRLFVLSFQGTALLYRGICIVCPIIGYCDGIRHYQNAFGWQTDIDNDFLEGTFAMWADSAISTDGLSS